MMKLKQKAVVVVSISMILLVMLFLSYFKTSATERVDRFR